MITQKGITRDITRFDLSEAWPLRLPHLHTDAGYRRLNLIQTLECWLPENRLSAMISSTTSSTSSIHMLRSLSHPSCSCALQSGWWTRPWWNQHPGISMWGSCVWCRHSLRPPLPHPCKENPDSPCLDVPCIHYYTTVYTRFSNIQLDDEPVLDGTCNPLVKICIDVGRVEVVPFRWPSSVRPLSI